MEEPLLEAEICPFLCLPCLFPFSKMSLIWKCSFVLFTALEVPVVSQPSCHFMLFTKIPHCSFFPQPPLAQPSRGIHPGIDKVLCHSLALLLCRGLGTKASLCTAGAVLGHIWSASGSVWPPGQAGGTSRAEVCSVADDELTKLQQC